MVQRGVQAGILKKKYKIIHLWWGGGGGERYKERVIKGLWDG